VDWRVLFKVNILNSAKDYILSDSIRDLTIEEDRVAASVVGLEDFHVEIEFADNEVSKMKCSCPYAAGGSNCKHMAAVMLAWEKVTSTVPSEPETEEKTETVKRR